MRVDERRPGTLAAHCCLHVYPSRFHACPPVASLTGMHKCGRLDPTRHSGQGRRSHRAISARSHRGCHAQSRTVTVPSYQTVALKVDEGWTSVDIYTEALHLDTEFDKVRVDLNINQNGGNAGDFAAAFILQCRKIDSESWTSVAPVPGQQRYFWDELTGMS